MSTLIKNDPILKKAHENYSRFNCDEKLREVYKNRLKFLRDKEMYETDAREKGYAEGISKGISQGTKEATRQIAINFKKLNIPITTIMEATGLTKEEIDSL